MALIFDRRVNVKTPGTFRTKVVTRGVDPQLCCYFKSSRLKQYFKEHRALRTETVISDTRDFGIGRRVNVGNWHALRAVAASTPTSVCVTPKKVIAPTGSRRGHPRRGQPGPRSQPTASPSPHSGSGTPG